MANGNNISHFFKLLLFLLTFHSCLAEIFFQERFEDGWKSRWVLSDWKRSEGKAGTFKHTAGKWSGDPDDKGLQTYMTPSILPYLQRYPS